MISPLTASIDPWGTWRICIFFGLSVSLLFYLKPYLHKVYGILWAYVLVYALYLFEFPSTPFGKYNTTFQATTEQNFTEILIMPLLFLSLKKNQINYLLDKFKWIIFIECVLILFGYSTYTLLNTPSFDLAMIALYLPFAPLWLILLSLLTIVTHHGGTALSILGMQLFIILMKSKSKRIKTFIGFSSLAIFGLSYFLQRDPWGEVVPLFHASERLAVYQKYMTFWWEKPRQIILGFGPGSFMWLSMLIDNFKAPIYFHMHSDWLQCLFELGVLGFLLIIIFYLQLVKKVFFFFLLLPAILGVGLFAATYHPFRFFPSAFLCGLIIVKILRRNQNAANMTFFTNT